MWHVSLNVTSVECLNMWFINGETQRKRCHLRRCVQSVFCQLSWMLLPYAFILQEGKIFHDSTFFWGGEKYECEFKWVRRSFTFCEFSTSFFLMLKMTWNRSLRSITRGSACVWTEIHQLILLYFDLISPKSSLIVWSSQKKRKESSQSYIHLSFCF